MSLFSLLLFLVFYLGLLGLSLWACWWFAFEFDSGRRLQWLLFRVAGFIVAAFLAIFLAKGLFHRSRLSRDDMLPVYQREEPQLFSFLRKLSKETGAPMPLAVFVSADVNAAVFYDSSLLSMFMPVRKNLVLGVALINGLTLSELKAVIAHEMGHFSQSTMRIGSYVYIANRVMRQLVSGRDWFDDFLENARLWDPRVAFPFYAISIFVWLIRRVLGGLFVVINLLHAALTRQMEFAADRVAVKAAGSDAITQALWKIGFAERCFAQALEDVGALADRGKTTNDLFHHQKGAEDYVRHVSGRADWGQPPKKVDAAYRLFQEDELALPPTMWATHPPNDEREAVAKQPYLPAELDDREAWVLFTNPGRLRRRMSMKFLGQNPNDLPEKAAELQKLIDAEHAEMSFDPRYEGVYWGRDLECGEPSRVAASVSQRRLGRNELTTMLGRLYGPELKRQGATLKKSAEEMRFLQHVAASARLQFRFHGAMYGKGELNMLITQQERQVEEIRKQLAAFDREVLEAHLQMARDLDGTDELIERYEFQVLVQRCRGHLYKAAEELRPGLQIINASGRLDEDAYHTLAMSIEDAFERVKAVLAEAAMGQIPRMHGFEERKDLRSHILTGALFAPQVTPETLGPCLDGLLHQINELDSRLARMHFKSLGSLLAFQTSIEEQWRAKAGYR